MYTEGNGSLNMSKFAFNNGTSITDKEAHVECDRALKSSKLSNMRPDQFQFVEPLTEA